MCGYRNSNYVRGEEPNPMKFLAVVFVRRRRSCLLMVISSVLAAALVTTTAIAIRAHTATDGATRSAGEDGFDPALLARIKQAEMYARTRPGFAGIVVRDRLTGAVWRNSDASTLIWACSTPKLAMVVDLLLRGDSGAVTPTAED